MNKYFKFCMLLFFLVIIASFSVHANDMIVVDLKFAGSDIFSSNDLTVLQDEIVYARNQFINPDGSATVYIPVKFMNDAISTIPESVKQFIFENGNEIVPSSTRIYTVVEKTDLSYYVTSEECNFDQKTQEETCKNLTSLMNENVYSYTLIPYSNENLRWSEIVYSFDVKNLQNAVRNGLKMYNNNLKDPTIVSACGTLSTQDELYTLNQDVASDDTCFVISNTGITLDCDGHTIEYANVSTGQGIELSGSADNTTIKNCIIRQVNASVQDSAGIYANSDDHNNLDVTNNTFDIECEDCDGVYLFSTGKTNMSFSFNNFTHGNSASNSHGIIMRSDFGYIFNNTFYIDQAGSSAGAISLQSGSNNNSIYNNHVIYTNFFGIYDDGDGDLVYNNTINHRRYCVLTSGDDIQFFNNTCISGSSNTYGIWMGGGDNVSVYGNTLDEDTATNVRCIYFRTNSVITAYVYNNTMYCGDGLNINTYATGTTTPVMYWWGNTITVTDDIIAGDKQSGLMDLYMENDTLSWSGDLVIEDERFVFSGVSYDKDDIGWTAGYDENYTNITNREFIRINVTQGGFPVSGAVFQVNNSLGETVSTGFTDVDGLTGFFVVSEYIANGTFTYTDICPVDSNVVCYTPLTITVVSGANSNTTIFNMTGKTTYNLTLAVSGDTTPPNINIDIPLNTTYSSVPTLNFTATDNVDIDKCWYMINGGSNVSISSCNNLSSIGSVGWNNLFVFVNDTSGNMANDSISFTISISGFSITQLIEFYETVHSVLISNHDYCYDNGTQVKNLSYVNCVTVSSVQTCWESYDLNFISCPTGCNTDTGECNYSTEEGFIIVVITIIFIVVAIGLAKRYS